MAGLSGCVTGEDIHGTRVRVSGGTLPELSVMLK